MNPPGIFAKRIPTDFVIGEDRFEDLQIKNTPGESFYYFYDQKIGRLIKQFILIEKQQVRYVCRVTLIKKGEKFTPRLIISIRDKKGQIAALAGSQDAEVHDAKANVSLEDCHESFWKLISFLQSLREIEVPRETFSLVSQGESEIVSALRERDSKSIVSIIRQLSSVKGVALSPQDVNRLLKRKERLGEFDTALRSNAGEKSWQDFFERNKWIFGYGLNYQILKQEQPQPNYGGTAINGRGGQRGDYLTSTVGDINFTVLVEIKTPKTPLLQGSQEIRSGAWSLSKELTDSVAQIEANISMWDKFGSERPENRDRLEKVSVYTVQPKGIIVIGSLAELKENRNKRETFQRFRKSIHGIDIITFDELHSRAQFIVERED